MFGWRHYETMSGWRPLVAIRNGYVSLLPLILFQGLLISASAVIGLAFDPAKTQALRDVLYYAHSFVWALMPMLSVVAIAYHAANLYGASRGYSVALALFVFARMVLPLEHPEALRLADANFSTNLYSLLLGPMVPWALSRLQSVSMMRLFRSPQNNAYITRSLNYLLPTVVIVVLAMLASHFIAQQHWAEAVERHVSTRDGWVDNPLGLAAYVVAINALWTCGVHGSMAMAPWVETLVAAFGQNQAAAALGQPLPHLFTSPAFHSFVHLGGSGSGLGLALAVLLVSRSRQKRVIGLSALPLLCFNVNEFLVYGLPVIFNRYLLLPFVLAPLACMLVAYAALATGLVPVPLYMPGWTTPPLLGAWIATGGSWAAVALAAFNLCLSTAIYIPFIRRWERTQQALGASMMEYKDRFRLASPSAEDTLDLDLTDALAAPKGGGDEVVDALALIREGEFRTYYQPIVEVASGRVVAVEALLRLQHRERGLMGPVFLPALKRAALSAEVDAWVLGSVVRQWSEWDGERHPCPLIHINVCPASLLKPEFVERLIESSRMLPLVVEVVEDELPEQLELLLPNVQLLQRNGVSLALDDFGVGHSSLSRLAKLGISELKIDKSMLDGAFERQRGRKLLTGIVMLSRGMGLRVCVEGVEHEAQLRMLRDCGAEMAQGYLFAKAMPWEQVRELIVSGRSLAPDARQPPGEPGT